MHLSAQEEYGLRCLLQVSRHQGGDPVGIPEIAEAEGLSPEYTAKLMRLLRRGGLVESTRGPGGGYRLARTSAQISVWQAIEVLGGPLYSDAFCESHRGKREDCVHSSACSVRSLWRWIGGAMRAALESVSLAQLSHDHATFSGALPLVSLPTARQGRA